MEASKVPGAGGAVQEDSAAGPSRSDVDPGFPHTVSSLRSHSGATEGTRSQEKYKLPQELLYHPTTSIKSASQSRCAVFFYLVCFFL